MSFQRRNGGSGTVEIDMQVAARVLLLVEARRYGILYFVFHPTMCSTRQRLITDEHSQIDHGKPTHLYVSWYVGEGLNVEGPRTSYRLLRLRQPPSIT